MKIKDVRINNWQPPGDKWWADAKARPTEPLIEATISMTLSWAEYKELLDRSESDAPRYIDPINPYTGEVSVLALAKNLQAGYNTFPENMGETVKKS